MMRTVLFTAAVALWADVEETQAAKPSNWHVTEPVERKNMTRLKELQFSDPTPAGVGTYGRVYDVKNLAGECRAVKFMKKETQTIESFKREVELLKALRHPNIIRVYKSDITKDGTYWFSSQLCSGGELFDYLADHYPMPEADIAKAMRALLGALKYLHAEGIVHRDLKPENVLLTESGSLEDLQLIDFGLAAKLKVQGWAGNPATASGFAGTPTYFAPEVASSKPYDASADMWSVGAMMYMMLSGRPLIDGEKEGGILQKYRRNPDRRYSALKSALERTVPGFSVLQKIRPGVSTEGLDFLRKLVVVDPKKRMTAEQALEHPWLKKKFDHRKTRVELKKVIREARVE